MRPCSHITTDCKFTKFFPFSTTVYHIKNDKIPCAILSSEQSRRPCFSGSGSSLGGFFAEDAVDDESKGTVAAYVAGRTKAVHGDV